MPDDDYLAHQVALITRLDLGGRRAILKEAIT